MAVIQPQNEPQAVQFDRPEQALQADLYWAVSSPDLMQLSDKIRAAGLSSIADSPLTSALTDWIQYNNHQAPLAKLITQCQPRRLGLYYELLWRYTLQNFPGFDLIAHNFAIREHHRTIGEFDFLYFCQQRQRFIHLETAVKFYLATPQSLLLGDTAEPRRSWSQWLGPGGKDRLDLKFLKMINQQSLLSNTPQAKQALSELGIDRVLREICLKGYFFYPFNRSYLAPIHSHTQHLQGYWLTLGTIDLLRDLLIDHTDCWQIIEKEQWLTPLSIADNQQPLKLNDLKPALAAQLALNPFPIMIANMQACSGDYNSDGYREIVRFFITPDAWPNK